MKGKQHTLWLLAALSAPLAHFSGSGWLMALGASAAVLPLALVPRAWDEPSRPLALLRLLWIGGALGVLLPGSAVYWPSDNDLAVPLTILALAVITDAAAAPRIGAVLALCIGLLSVPGAVSGAVHLHPEQLAPSAAAWPWGLTLALLLPSLPAAEGGEKRNTAYAGFLASALSALVQGTISLKVASTVPDPFYQTARTLGYLEPVLAAAVTLGWYAMTVYLLQSARIIASESGMGRRWATVLPLGTAAFGIVWGVQPMIPFWSLFGVFLWVLAPFLTKIKKDEKT